MGHQSVDKIYNRIKKRIEWPVLKNRFLHACHVGKDPRKLVFFLQSIESSKFNEVGQIDHQNICMTATRYNQKRAMIDHLSKHSEAIPCLRASADETCDQLINVWIARHGCPIIFQSDNEKHSSVISSRKGRKWRRPTRPLITLRRMTWWSGKIAH